MLNENGDGVVPEGVHEEVCVVVKDKTKKNTSFHLNGRKRKNDPRSVVVRTC